MDSSPSPHKKHKKHKKHKHKNKRKDGEEEEEGIDIVGDGGETPKPAIKLKIKFGGATLGTKSVSTDNVDPSEPQLGGLISSPPLPPGMVLPPGGAATPWEEGEEPSFNTKKPGDDTSDEEKEWLEALEAGKLDDSGGLKKSKDPKLLTARQRALLHGGKEEGLLELPSGYKTPELTEEQLQRRKQRAKKRREQAFEKREKDKKETVERLLKKQESKAKASSKPKTGRKSQPPGFRYVNNQKTITVSVPQGFKFPFQPSTAPQPPPQKLCGVSGCKNNRKYSCSKTGVSLCSLECYRKNLKLQGPPTVPAVS